MLKPTWRKKLCSRMTTQKQWNASQTRGHGEVSGSLDPIRVGELHISVPRCSPTFVYQEFKLALFIKQPTNQPANQPINQPIIFYKEDYQSWNLSIQGMRIPRPWESPNDGGTKAHHITIDALLQHWIASSNLRTHQHIAWRFETINGSREKKKRTTGNWWKLDATICHIWFNSKLWGFKLHKNGMGRSYLLIYNRKH